MAHSSGFAGSVGLVCSPDKWLFNDEEEAINSYVARKGENQAHEGTRNQSWAVGMDISDTVHWIAKLLVRATYCKLAVRPFDKQIPKIISVYADNPGCPKLNSKTDHSQQDKQAHPQGKW